jgi:predicted DNA-binding protein (UPF0251 family)
VADLVSEERRKGRPPKIRVLTCEYAEGVSFGPLVSGQDTVGSCNCEPTVVDLGWDRLEALRLADELRWPQKCIGRRMGVSQTAANVLVLSARRSVAQVLIEGTTLRICRPQDVRFADGNMYSRVYVCGTCFGEVTVPCCRPRPATCGACGGVLHRSTCKVLPDHTPSLLDISCEPCQVPVAGLCSERCRSQMRRGVV